MKSLLLLSALLLALPASAQPEVPAPADLQSLTSDLSSSPQNPEPLNPEPLNPEPLNPDF